mmetsp:Transcript_1189/g.3332  ORF Transcript_1189/g.3332 Transcript_1189/m.3332 type:complete len:472 (-) Transcript_1189:160-1575(-)
MVPPGTAFTYDSDTFIQYLSYLIDAVVTDDSPTGWATRAFAEPLGIPELFAYDGQVYGIGGNISTGGGQMMSCRDVARVGTLINNGGRWVSPAGEVVSLVSEDYMAQLSRPSFPAFNKGYGFLTWLNTNVGPDGPHCCAPRWSSVGFVNQTNGSVSRRGSCCAVLNNSGVKPLPCDLFATNSLNEEAATDHYPYKMLWDGAQYIEQSIIDDNTPAGLPRAPYDLMMGQGEGGEYMFMVPSLNLTVVTMGSSYPRSKICSDGYDDAFTVSLAWNAISGAFVPTAERAATAALTAPERAAGGSPARPGPPLRPVDGAAEPRQRRQSRAAAATDTAQMAGSCQCDCPSGQGFGRCFNVPSADIPPHVDPNLPTFRCSHLGPNSTVGRKILSPAAFCPMLGMTVNCDPTINHNSSLLCRRGLHKCDVLSECSTIEGMPSTFAVATCACPTSNYISMSPCVWSRQPCVYTPYYLPG